MIEKLKEVILNKTNEVFLKTLQQKELPQKLLFLNTYAGWIDLISKEYPDKDDVINLWQEAYLDLISSFFNASNGFYRQSIISLRSVLELTSLGVYYFDHPIEFNYFKKEGDYKAPMLSQLIDNEGFLAKKYCLLFIDESKMKKELHTEIRQVYKKLSHYVHGRLNKLQTITQLSISFNEKELSNFLTFWETIIKLVNTIIFIRFSKDISKMDEDIKITVYELIKNTGIVEIG